MDVVTEDRLIGTSITGKCVVCNQSLSINHKCTASGLARFNRSEGGKNAYRTKADTFRYGTGNTCGDNIREGSYLHSLGGDK